MAVCIQIFYLRIQTGNTFVTTESSTEQFSLFMNYLFLFKKLNYRKKSGRREGGRERISSICGLTPQVAEMSKAGPVLSQELGTSLRSRAWTHAHRHLGHSLLLPQAILRELNQKWRARTEPGPEGMLIPALLEHGLQAVLFLIWG